jgi:hypothetical protein
VNAKYCHLPTCPLVDEIFGQDYNIALEILGEVQKSNGILSNIKITKDKGVGTSALSFFLHLI